MPCLSEEIEGALEEGAELQCLAAPVRVERTGAGRLAVTCVKMRLGEPDSSGRRRPIPIRGSEFTVEADTVVAAIGQRVELELPRCEGLAVTRWGIAADPKTLATNLAGVFAGGDAVSGPDVAVRAVAAGRIAAASIDQYLRGEPVRGEPQPVSILMRALDETELAAMYRDIERRPRVKGPQLDIQRRRRSFEQIEGPLSEEQARLEAGRCMSCTCSKVDGCRLRRFATEYGADPYRFAGERRRFERDTSHPEITYEPGKCIMCDVCVRVAEQAGEPIGLTLIGRGFQVAVGVPFGLSIKEALQKSARRAAELCPTGALSLKRQRACELCLSGEFGTLAASPQQVSD